MLSAGIDRLVAGGVDRIKISFEFQAAGATYLGLGFQQESTATWYSSSGSGH